jgi:hypothetical protein
MAWIEVTTVDHDGAHRPWALNTLHLIGIAPTTGRPGAQAMLSLIEYESPVFVTETHQELFNRIVRAEAKPVESAS